MEVDDSPGSGGSTPVQDEPIYHDSDGQEEPDGEGMLVDGRGSDTESQRGGLQDDDADAEYVSDGGEVEREEVEREMDDEEDMSDTNRSGDDNNEDGPRSPASPSMSVDGPASPQQASYSPHGSPVGSPAGSGSNRSPPASPSSMPASPSAPLDYSPHSPGGNESEPENFNQAVSPDVSKDQDESQDALASPAGSCSRSPARSGDRSPSPAGSGVRSPSPAGSGVRSPSPAGSGVRSPSPAVSGPRSPSPTRSGSRSPSPARSRSPSPVRSGSRSPSPAKSRSHSPSPTRSGSRSPSPARSRSHSPSPARSGSHSPRSRSGSPARSRSGSPARSRSGSPSPARSGSHSPSPARSGSRSPSPARSGSRSPSPARSRSGSPSPARSGSRSPSPARSGSHSPSPARSRSGSPGSVRSRSRSGSPASGRSGSRSPSPRGSRSRSGSRSPSPARSRSRSGSPDSDDEGRKRKRKIDKGKGSDDEDDSDKESEAGDLIADIFGSSDEDEEFEGFVEADVEAANKKKEKKKQSILSDDEGDSEVPTGAAVGNEVLPELSDDENEDEARQSGQADFVSDFELMMAKKKEEMTKRRKRRGNVDIINDSDDLIADMIVKMKEAAEEDRELNRKRQPAFRKRTYLPVVVSQLKKSDLHSFFLDSGVLNAITEWLAPLPDKSLPHLQIRESLLRILSEFPTINAGALKSSGIGKAVMYLYKHPKETKENRERSGKLINEWARPIFNLSSLSKEEREQRDYDQLGSKRRRLSSEGMTPSRDIDNALSGEAQGLRPGEKGWIMRARVPKPSIKDYVVRPKWKVEERVKSGGGKKEPTRYEKHVRAFAEKKKFGKSQRAVTISIEGRNMAL